MNLSATTLIAANLIPLVGALFFDWNAILILALFWIENLIIGGFNLVKMLSLSVYKKELKGLFLCVFFIVHYGTFCTIHGVILWDILGLGDLDTSAYFSSELDSIGALFSKGATVLLSFIDMFKPQIWLGIAALAMSHCVSFIENFILRGEVFNNEPKDLMSKPYPQILILHVGLIVGAIAVEKLGSPIWLLLIIITFKIVVEIVLHQRKYNKTLKNTSLNNVKQN